MATPYEVSARWNKAVQLAAHLHAHGVRSDQVPDISQEHWARLADRVQVNRPSAETQALVTKVVAIFEQAKAEMIRDTGAA